MQRVLDTTPESNLHVFVIWEPMLPTDWAKPGKAVLARVSDRRASQVWDPDHLFAKELGRALDADPQHPRPHCCEDGGILWDLVAVYSRSVRWEETLPRSVLIDGPVWKVDQLAGSLEE